MDTENPGNVIGWSTDLDFFVRGATTMNADGSYTLMVRDAADKPWRKLLHVDADDQAQIAFFGKDPNDVYIISSHGGNAVRLFKVDGKSAKETVVAEDEKTTTWAAHSLSEGRTVRWRLRS